MLSMLMDADAEIKIVIAGNHDITHDQEYYERVGYLRHRCPGTDFDAYPDGGKNSKNGMSGRTVHLAKGENEAVSNKLMKTTTVVTGGEKTPEK